MPLIQVHDWNLNIRYYEMSENHLTEMMSLARNKREAYFNKHTKMARIHCDNECDYYLPIYTEEDDWDEAEEEWEAG